MKVAIIGVNAPLNAQIEVMEKLFEQQRGITITLKESELFDSKLKAKEIEPYILKTIERFTPPPVPKIKGHERPYKYHR